MDQGQVLELEALLAPFSDEAPTGIDLREDASPQSIYYRVKDLRASARAAERRDDAGDEGAGVPGEWREILKLTQQALTEQSKDLEFACWLLEALVRIDGFRGLCDGTELLARLIGTYDTKLHSLRDEDGLETFFAPLTGLNGADAEGSLIQPIRKVPITAGGDRSFAAFHYAQAEDLAKLTDDAARQRRIAAGVPTIEAFEAALRGSPKEFLRGLLKDLAGANASAERLSSILSEKYGADAPPTGRIREAIESVLDLVSSQTRDLLPPEPASHGNGLDAAAAETAATSASAVATPAVGAIANREDALRTLAKISEFFRETEPHSTIAFTLDDVIRRARMSLPELLAELLPDEAARRTFLVSAGIKPPSG